MNDTDVLLDLLGREFLIKAEPEKLASLQAAVDLLQSRVERLSKEHPNQSLNKLLVLAGLTLATDYLDLRETAKAPEQAFSNRIETVLTQLQALLPE